MWFAKGKVQISNLTELWNMTLQWNWVIEPIIKKIANFHTKMTIFPMVNALQKSWNSYLEEMAPHTNMHNGISLKTATTLSKFSFLDEENTPKLHFIITLLNTAVLFLRRSQHVNWQVASWLLLSWSADERQTSGEPLLSTAAAQLVPLLWSSGSAKTQFFPSADERLPTTKRHFERRY